MISIKYCQITSCKSQPISFGQNAGYKPAARVLLFVSKITTQLQREKQLSRFLSLFRRNWIIAEIEILYFPPIFKHLWPKSSYDGEHFRMCMMNWKISDGFHKILNSILYCTLCPISLHPFLQTFLILSFFWIIFLSQISLSLQFFCSAKNFSANKNKIR